MAEQHVPTAGAPRDDAARTEAWRSILMRDDATLRKLRRWWRLLPSSPRCKVCAAPLHGPGKLATSIIMHGQSKLNPMMCGPCFRDLGEFPGGSVAVPASCRSAVTRRSTPDSLSPAARCGPSTSPVAPERSTSWSRAFPG